MQTCANCKHWKVKAHTTPEWGGCKRGSSEHGQPDDPASKAVAYDFEGYRAFLDTAPDFGCVMFEPR